MIYLLPFIVTFWRIATANSLGTPTNDNIGVNVDNVALTSGDLLNEVPEAVVPPSTWKDQMILDYMLHMETLYWREHYYVEKAFIPQGNWMWEVARTKADDMMQDDVTESLDDLLKGFHNWLSDSDKRYKRCAFGSSGQINGLDETGYCMWNKMSLISNGGVKDILNNYVYEIAFGYGFDTCQLPNWNGPLPKLVTAEDVMQAYINCPEHRPVILGQGYWANYQNWTMMGARAGFCRVSIFFTLSTSTADDDTGVVVQYT